MGEQADNWAGSEAGRLTRRIRVLEAQLAVLQWQPITAENLPKVGDEVGRFFNRPVIALVTAGILATRPCDFHWHRLGWAHFRPNNPPKES